MVTKAQFDADTYQRREVVTAELDWLGDELCRRTGRPREAAGTKGDYKHLRGSHRSQDFIKRSALCTSRTYTVQSGLTAAQERHIAGFDFTPGSDTAMVAQCERIYNAMRAGQLDEVREFYGNINGDQVVDGWNNIENRNASSDDSHLWHWHLGLDRRHCTNRALMERIIAIALGEEDDDMFEDKDRDALTSANYRTYGLWQDLDEVGFTITSGRKFAEKNLAKAARVALEQKVSAMLTALAGVDEAVATQLKGQFDQIDAGLAATRAEVADVDEQVASRLGANDLTAQEKADLLRTVLGDDAAAVGALLAQS